MNSDKNNHLLQNLNQQQTEAVCHTDGPLLIVAGAGTGKTTVITRRIAYLIEQGLAKPDEILALTFTEKASGEMKERIDLLMPLGYYDYWISTFHSFGERILKLHALDIGISNDFELLDSIRQWILVNKNFEKFDLDYYRPLGSPNRFIDALLQHFSRCKDELITPTEYLEYAEEIRLNTNKPQPHPALSSKGERGEQDKKASEEIPLHKDPALNDNRIKKNDINESEIARLEEVAGAFHTYQKLLLDNNFLDFGDLINYTLRLFKTRPKILKYYQKKFKYILVDEFQDTNFAQFEMVKMLAGDTGNLTVVGDDDQSIYKFRGASVSNILKFKEQFSTAKQISLTENYRSTQNILDLAYKFIQGNNPDRLEVKLGIDKKLHANHSGSPQLGNIEVIEAEDLNEELNAVAKKIVELKNLDLQTTTWNDFAILFRANSATESLLPILASHQIPFTFLANQGLYKKPIIADLINYFSLLCNAFNSPSLYRVFHFPKFKLSHLELSELLEYSKKKTISLYETLTPALTFPNLSKDAKEKINSLLLLLQKHAQALTDKTAVEMLIGIIGDLGILKTVETETAETVENRELLDQFYKKIENFEKVSAEKDLRAFLAYLNLEMSAGSEGSLNFDPNVGPETVKVLTVHSAKGLEFKYVFIINLVDQRFPSREIGEAIAIPTELVKDILPEGDFHLQEERRLFYVALTRAKQGLYLTWAKNYGGAKTKKPSLFLVESGLVPSDLVSQATGKVLFSKPKQTPIQIFHKLPTKFSFSELNDFNLCPLAYKYKYYLKLPLAGSHYFSFGSTIHKVFEEFYKLYKNNLSQTQTDLFGKKLSLTPVPNFTILEKLYEKHWIDDWYDSPAQKGKYKQEGKAMLETFYQNLLNEKPTPKYIEQFFKLKLGEFDFVGKIDRADTGKGGVVIIDYKTGKKPKGKKDLDQLYIYQWAAEDFLKEKVHSLKYWYLKEAPENQFKIEKPADAEEIQTLKSNLHETMKKIVEAVQYDSFTELHKQWSKHECQFENLE